MDVDVNQWKKLNLQRNQFESTALDFMICDNIKTKKKEDHHVCTKAELADKANEILPQALPKWHETQKLRHFTFTFNIFVFLQIFNIINSRKIEGELNVFSSFFNNCLFIFIIFLTIAVQVFIVDFGKMATKTTALNTMENLVCIGIGFSSLIVGFFIKFLPLKLFQCVSLDDKPSNEPEENASPSVVQRLKGIKGGSTKVKVETGNKHANKVGEQLLMNNPALMKLKMAREQQM